MLIFRLTNQLKEVFVEKFDCFFLLNTSKFVLSISISTLGIAKSG